MKSKDWLMLSIITFLTAAAWTVYEVYHQATTTTITPVQQEMVKPLDPTFDLDTLRQVAGRDD
jgi:hypothetical protein